MDEKVINFIPIEYVTELCSQLFYLKKKKEKRNVSTLCTTKFDFSKLKKKKMLKCIMGAANTND